MPQDYTALQTGHVILRDFYSPELSFVSRDVCAVDNIILPESNLLGAFCMFDSSTDPTSPHKSNAHSIDALYENYSFDKKWL
jgi:hypothetical protein